MKRILAVLAVAGLVIGGGAAAFAATAGGGGDKGAKRDAARACLDRARKDHPDAKGAALRDVAKPCLEAAGIQVLTPEQKAAAKKCVQDARAAHPDAKRGELADVVKPCLQAAGIDPDKVVRPHPVRAALRQCVADARKADPTAPVVDLARKCVESGQVGKNLTPDQKQKLLNRLSCVQQVRKDHPDAKGKAFRDLVKAQCAPKKAG